MTSCLLSLQSTLQHSVLKTRASGPTAARLSLTFHLQRSQSTLSTDLQYQFVTAASFIGKRISNYELEISQLSTKKSKGFPEWVERTKKEWAQGYLARNRVPEEPTHARLTYSGQDWWFVHERNRGNFETFVGVADGVGGWLESGVDPADVSQGLMFYSDQFLQKDNNTEANETPNSILTQAFKKILADKKIEGGSSTALVAKLDPRVGSLQWTTLGDSTLLLIRPSMKEVLIETESQTHYFNCPYQLTKFPPGMSGEIQSDTPAMASCGSYPSLRDGDLVLLYTDGIGDNVWPQEILKLIELTSQENLPDSKFTQSLADRICKFAFDASLSKDRLTPFQKAKSRGTRINSLGGKEDDVTLTVSLVRRINS